MTNSIPSFDHNLVLPPHKGSPAVKSDLSPYPCTSLELCQRFATSAERIAILDGFLHFREKLQSLGLHQGFQWLDGSFLENVELRENRPPNDLDIVTVYWGYDLTFQNTLVSQFPEFASPRKAKANYQLDHYPVDAGHHPKTTIESTRYWIQLFSHNRDAVWKGMLKIDLNTPDLDNLARQQLSQVQP